MDRLGVDRAPDPHLALKARLFPVIQLFQDRCHVAREKDVPIICQA